MNKRTTKKIQPEQKLNSEPNADDISVSPVIANTNVSSSDYGTDKYCTCEKHNYDSHTCPYGQEINDSDDECTCCPYCEHQCCMDI